MLQGIGVDLVAQSQAKRFVDHHSNGLKRFLNPSEYQLFKKSKSKVECFALLFAAKEAVSKALGISVTHPAAFKQFVIIKTKRNGLTAKWNSSQIGNQKLNFHLIPFRLKTSLGMMAFAFKS